MNPEYIILHHSLTEDGQTVNWQAICKYHIETNGWNDVGYHYGLERIGDKYEILKGRMDNETGAHCLGFNDKSIGICLIGNYDITPPSMEQYALLAKLVHSLMGIYGIKNDKIIGHFESYGLLDKPIAKTCPGSRFSMNEFRRMV